MLSSRVKQRVVGSLVLLALVVVLVPLIFDLEPSTPVDQTTEIPAAPDIEAAVMEEPVEPVVDNEVVPLDQLFDLAPPTDSKEGAEISEPPNSEPVTESAAAEETLERVEKENVLAAPKLEEEPLQSPPKTLPRVEPKVAETGLPEAWVIQVVSYQEKTKAEALNQKLQGAGFKSFVRSAGVSGRTVHRVFVGPQILRQHADEEKLRIDRSLGVNSMVIPFEP